MNYRMISYTLGWILMFESAFLVVPSITAIVFGEYSCLFDFLITAAICLVVGFLMTVIKPKNRALRSRDGFVIVALSWVLLSLFGAIPFMMTGVTKNYIDALFETVSGFTTTGSSIFTDVESLPKSVIMWRSFTHWIGGMGILVFVMAFLPLSGGTNMYIMKAESPGPTVSKPVPKIKMTAMLLYVVYIVLTALQFVMLLFGKLNAFEALNISLSTAGTGGFGFFNDSMKSFSPYVQIVTSVFMVLFSINFSSYFFLIRGKLKEAFNTEVKVFLGIVAVAVLIITLNIRTIYNNDIGISLRHAFFTVSSLISTTGFATEDFNMWPSLSKSILMGIIMIGACAGSTGGGIKISRIIVLVKLLFREIKTVLHPKQIKKITVDGAVIERDVVRSIYGFLFCYIAIFVSALFLISLDGKDLVTNFTAISATLGNVGPGLSLVGPTGNYSHFSMLSKLVMTFCMLAGRLELFPMMILFMPSTWKK